MQGSILYHGRHRLNKVAVAREITRTPLQPKKIGLERQMCPCLFSTTKGGLYHQDALVTIAVGPQRRYYVDIATNAIEPNCLTLALRLSIQYASSLPHSNALGKKRFQ